MLHTDPVGSPLATVLERIAHDVAARSGVTLRVAAGAESNLPGRPALTVRHAARDVAHWLAAPTGPEEPPFLQLLADLAAARSAAPRPASADAAIRVEVFVAAACPHCPHAVAAALAAALADPRIEVLVIDAEIFAGMAAAVPVRSVPTTIVAGGTTIVGQITQAALEVRIAALTGPERDLEVMASLIANGRLDDAADEVLAGAGVAPFAELWRSASMEGRIGLTLAAEQALARAPAALDGIVPILLEILDTPEPGRRGDTVDLLGRIRHPAARRALELLRTDPDEDIAEAAADALVQLELRSIDA